MISISKSYSFDAAHQLWRNDWDEGMNLEVFGKCARLHGHTYTLEVTVQGKVDPETGMILNYFDLDKIVKPLVDQEFDHKDLNKVFRDTLTTAENMVADIDNNLDPILNHRYQDDHFYLVKVSLAETPKTTAVWSRSR